MIKFFRNIRQSMITQNRVSKYLIYAIGEIILVVIGILIALWINNYNSRISTQSEIRDYYAKILSELDENIEHFEQGLADRKKFKARTERALNLFAGKNLDSTALFLKNLGAIRNINSISPRFPIIEEFLSQNFLAKIENDSIKSKFSEFSEMEKWIDLVDAFAINQHQTTIEPFLIKNYNYTQITIDQNENMVKLGPDSNVQNIWDNLKLWNIIYIKMETWEYENQAINWGLNILRNLRSLIAKELDLNIT